MLVDMSCFEYLGPGHQILSMSLHFSPEPAPPNRDPVDDDEEEDDCFETDEGASGWLESIGLDKKEFPTLDPRKVKLYPLN